MDPETYRKAGKVAEAADIFVIIGTTGLVYPASDIPGFSKTFGAVIIEINRKWSAHKSSLKDIFIQEKAIRGMEKLLEDVLEL